MKFKFFAAATAALALAACNNEEMLEVNNPSVGSSNVVFGLAVDNDATRAQWNNSYTLQWVKEHADKMSLFHGITLSGTAATKAQNAIYSASATDENGRPVFTTQNMVVEGLSVMVYPCDTTFTYDGNKLYVSVPQNQTEATNLQIPFVSNAINIAPFKAGAADGAGYARQYDIALKQVGTLLTLKANWESDNYDAIKALSDAGTIQPLALSGVTLKTANAFFSNEAEIQVTATKPNPDPSKPLNTASRDAWSNVTEAVHSGNYASNSVSTTAIAEDLKTCEFVLLPYNNVTYGAANDSYITEANTAIVVNTNYGTVTLQDKGKVWYKDGEKDGSGNQIYNTISEGLIRILPLTNNVKATDAKSYFRGEKVGGHIARIVNCDLSDIDMSTVHIKSNKQLLDMIAVHEAIQPETPVVFTLDGDANKTFEMPVSTVAKLNALPKITIKACEEAAEKLQYIKLTGATEVPNIEFMDNTSAGINVVLADEGNTSWTWTGGEKKFTKVWNFVNKGRLNVQAGAVVAGKVGNEMINDGTMNIIGDATQKISFTNNSNMFIGTGVYYAVDNVIFINNAASLTEQGSISNKGEFGAINGGKIKNFGYIKQATAQSKTFITTNQTSPASITSAFGANNKFGTIELYDVNDNRYSITDDNSEGFIKITTTAANVTKNNVGVEANYVVIAGDCTTLSTQNFPGRVAYIEINSNKEVEWTSYNKSLTGLIVNEGCKLYLPKSNTASADNAYVKGRIYRGGSLTISNYVSYFGGAATDKANVLTY